VAAAGAAVRPAGRRHYLRVTGEAHPGLERRIESLVRRAGLTVQNRATRSEGDRVHLAFMLSPSQDEPLEAVRESVARLARVEACLCLGVLE
jgi:hypothetical protein